MLTTSPMLVGALPAPFEGDTVNVSFNFTDSVAAASGDLGLDPADYTSIGVFDTGLYTAISSIVIDSSLAAPTLTVNYGAGLTQVFTGVVAPVPPVTGPISPDVAPGSPSFNFASAPLDIAVFTFSSFTLDSSYTITATGSRPVSLLSKADMTIAGTIDVSANGTTAGAGGGKGGTTGSTPNGLAAMGGPVVEQTLVIGPNTFVFPIPSDPANAFGRYTLGGGGGGGGFGGAGGKGSDGSTSDTNNGAGYGDLYVAIQGGSGGASGSVSGTQFGFGGGGGGGIELGAVGTIVVSGSILADGADGSLLIQNAGGGGAGGGILVHAAVVDISGSLSAEGGAGAALLSTSSGGGGGGGGHILIGYATSFDDDGVYSVAGGTAVSSTATAGAAGVLNVEQIAGAPVTEAYSFSIDWGDGSTPTTGSYAGGQITLTPAVPAPPSVTGTFSGSHLYADDDEQFVSYVITVTVTDAQGAAVNTFDIDVANVAPTLVLTGASSVAEGSSYTLGLASSDPGQDTIASWAINWGDGSPVEIVSGNPTSVEHFYADGPNAYSITATATDEDGTFAASNSVAVSVSNVAPVIVPGSLTNDGGMIGDKGVNQAVAIALSLADPGFGDSHLVTFEWGDGVVTTVSLAAGVTSAANSHAYASAGAYDVKITVDDLGGGTDVIYTTVFVTGVNLRGSVLQIVGGSQKDVVQVVKHGSSTVKAYAKLGAAAQTVTSYALGGVSSVEMYLGAGNDYGYVSNNLAIPAVMFGGAGDDTLISGSGNDSLFGGDGYDVVVGNGGSDLIIGGEQSDILFAGTGGDILVGGYSTWEINGTLTSDAEGPLGSRLADLNGVLAAWTSGSTYTVRKAAVQALLVDAVFDDDDVDVMHGGSGQDLFFAGDSGCLMDIILGRVGSESLVELPELV